MMIVRFISDWPVLGSIISGNSLSVSTTSPAQFIFAGARAVQIGTAIMDEGVEVFSRINEGLEKFMAEKGYGSIDEMVGIAHD